ncbi:MAG: LPP20 family lipoprotein [Planctomycetes bacterium]|nr:LPP20 family lipoprotein [Planctomycetota bacterium]
MHEWQSDGFSRRQAARLYPEGVAFLAAAVLLSSVCGCFTTGGSPPAGDGGAGDAPDWVRGQPARYPSARYLSAVGTGASRAMAEENARAELARIFRSEIDSRTRTYEKYLQASSGAKTRSSEEISQENLTVISTRKVIEGSEIAEVYRQKQPEAHYALAILDRSRSAEMLKDRLDRLDSEIESLLKEAHGITDKLDRLRTLHRSVPKFALRDAYDTELRIVSAEGGGRASPHRFADVQAELDQLLFQDLSIAVRVKGHGSEELRASLLERLGRLNLKVERDEADRTYDLTIEVETLFKVVPRSEEFVDSRWEAKARLLNRNRQELDASTVQGGGGYLNRALAEEMALKELREKAPEAAAAHVARYLFGH